MNMGTDMNEALFRLMSWLSPAYPVGAYSFSHGLEYAVEEGLVTDADSASNWIATIMTNGNGFADLVFVAAAYDSDPEQLPDLNEVALAFQGTAELRLESTAQGGAFVRVTRDAWPCEAMKTLEEIAADGVSYAVAFGAVAKSHGVDRRDAALAYAHAFAANLVSAAVRLIPLGQTDGQRITAELMPTCIETVGRATLATVDDVATSTPMVDIASMKHEHQYTRLFRS
ncbi:MAG: urease accessory protein UreF [Woeseiaceae bacterium]|nr:urease accessory protein UreF [Woeseiaceae bacterium]